MRRLLLVLTAMFLIAPSTDANTVCARNRSSDVVTADGGGVSSDGTVNGDLEMGNTPYSIDGGTSGLAFDPDNDGTNEVTISTAGGSTPHSLTVSRASSIDAGSTGLDFVDSNTTFVGISDDIETAVSNATAGGILVLAAGGYTP